jgi:hypothetical protein
MAKANDTFSTLHEALAFRNNEHLQRFCRKFSFVVICSMLSPYDQR